ncbi:MAG: hypothetical protein Q8P45_00395 [Candidatus Harrisonbacteria bacterium]|nr:hypothetical protein [Candidatus Harrisonbacteria bacterium]
MKRALSIGTEYPPFPKRKIRWHARELDGSWYVQCVDREGAVLTHLFSSGTISASCERSARLEAYRLNQHERGCEELLKKLHQQELAEA